MNHKTLSPLHGDLEEAALRQLRQLVSRNHHPPFFMAYNQTPHAPNGRWMTEYGEVKFWYAHELADGMVWVMDRERFERFFRTNTDSWRIPE